MLPFLFSNFVQKWYIPRGINHGETAIMQIFDTDRDADLEFIFTVYEVGPSYLHFYELHLPDVWEVDSFLFPYYHGLYGSGDFDLDGFYDFVLMFHSESPSLANGIAIYESPDSFSYPTQEVWRDTVGSPLVTPICVYDIDEDSLPEIVKVLGDYIHLHIYESIGNNLYDKIEEITTSSTHNSSSTLAFGDFDSDNKNEFVWGYSAGEYSIWECTGNNSYQEILLQQLPTVNIKDCFSVADADGDGKLEFVVKGFWVYGTIDAFIFEATGDNTYEIVDTFHLSDGDYYGGYSDAGDVDGDSIPEIVLEARQNVFIIKADGNDSFYVWDTLPGHASGSSIAVYDIDENGLAEIVISGNNETRIYEYDPGGMEEARSRKPEARYGLQVSPNPFKDKLNIRYQIPEKNRVNMKIYNAAGLLVKDFSLYSSGIGGQVSVKVWDGKDNSGQQVPSGVYFVRLETPNKSITKKIIKLK